MKNISCAVLLSLFLILSAAGAFCEEQEQSKTPGLSREYWFGAEWGCDTVSGIAEKYGIEPTETGHNKLGKILFYTPSEGGPLNIYVVANDEYWAYPEKQIGTVGLGGVGTWDWKRSIENGSNGILRFVDDPDHADVILVANRYYWFFANYLWRNVVTVPGYACDIALGAFLLSDPDEKCVVIKSNRPGKSVTTSQHYESGFYMDSPTFENSAEAKKLIMAILSWYGYETAPGSEGKNVQRLRQALTARGYLAENADTDSVFDTEMEAAVKELQRNYGLEESGTIDRPTLVAVFYDRETVDQMLAKYPVE